MKHIPLFLLTCLLTFIPLSVHAEISYSDAYANSVTDACDHHYEMLENGEISNEGYNDIGYALSDITGDGICELIVRQVIGKHWAEYWVFNTDGYAGYFICWFGCYARSLYGYEEGILYEEAYKGDVSLSLARWDGNEFTVIPLYSGTYNRDSYPPSIPDLQDCYDPYCLLEEVPDFQPLDYGTRVSRYSPDPYYPSDPYDLSNYGYRTVVTGGQGPLVFQTEPGGSFLWDHSFGDGSRIFVNLSWRNQGYALAYDNGTYGLVDASYINWGNAPGPAYDPHNLDDYGYRTVSTEGRGNLIFQTEPGGSFMNDYQYRDGDTIYVNLYWRENGYAIAYQNGVYGYVDAGYINW